MDADFKARLVAYRTSMSLAESLFFDGIITEKEYDKIDRIMAKKHGLSLGSIWCRKPLILLHYRANIPQTGGGEVLGTDD